MCSLGSRVLYYYNQPQLSANIQNDFRTKVNSAVRESNLSIGENRHLDNLIHMAGTAAIVMAPAVREIVLKSVTSIIIWKLKLDKKIRGTPTDTHQV